VKNQRLKREIRLAAEKVEHSFYRERASKDWKDALQVLGTDYRKPFLEKAPYLIVIFVQKYGLSPSGVKIRHYYPLKSVGIATGFLLTALHRLGISALTYTPSPMNFLNSILKRPENETPYLILVVGYAARDASVPDIGRKSFEEICITM
jgi:nitroreductase